MNKLQASQEVNYRPTPWRVALQQESMTLLERFVVVAEQQRLPYLILNGTLLGATKFQGVIPWDDDADIGVLRRDVPLLQEVLAEVVSGTKYRMQEVLYGFILSGPQHGLVDLLILDQDPMTQYYEMCYPLIKDVPTFWSGRARPLRLTAEELFPLRRYTFDHLSLWGPAQGAQICLRLYGSEVYQRNQRPDGGLGIHPLVPTLLPPVSRVASFLGEQLATYCPKLFERSLRMRACPKLIHR